MIMPSIAYAMGPPSEGAGAGNPIMSFLPLIVIFAIFYFLLIRPQQKKAKDHRNFLESLKRGDEVVTAGGLIGKISGLTDKVVTLEIANSVKVKVTRAQVSGAAPSQEKGD
jgi:preprotein translocase subunit YajC